MDATRLYLADCVGVIVLPISRIIIASYYCSCYVFCEINLFVVTWFARVSHGNMVCARARVAWLHGLPI